MKKILLSLVAVLMFAGILHAAGTSSPITGFSWDNVRKVVRFMTSDGAEIQVAEAPKQYTAITGGAASNCGSTDTTLKVCSDQAGWNMSTGSATPYRTSDGKWRVRLNFYGTYTSVNTSNVLLKVSGMIFGTNQPQALSGYFEPINSATLRAAYTNNGSQNVMIYMLQTANTSAAAVSGDVELASKPTFAD